MHPRASIAVAELARAERSHGAQSRLAQARSKRSTAAVAAVSNKRAGGRGHELVEARERLIALVAVELLPVAHAPVRSETPEHDRPPAIAIAGAGELARDGAAHEQRVLARCEHLDRVRLDAGHRTRSVRSARTNAMIPCAGPQPSAR